MKIKRRRKFSRLTIGNANLFVRNARQDAGILRLAYWWKRRHGFFPDAIAGQEARQVLSVPLLGSLYRIVGDEYGVVAVKRWFKITHAERRDGAPAIGTSGPNRKPRKDWHVGFVKRGQPVMVINSHLHVVPEEELADLPFTEWGRAGKAHSRHADKVSAAALEHSLNGWLTVVCADANTLRGTRWTGSLHHKMRNIGYRSFAHRIDGIWYPPNVEIQSGAIVDKGVVGSDKHASLIAALVPKVEK